jgi:hypothetical protein
MLGWMPSCRGAWPGSADFASHFALYLCWPSCHLIAITLAPAAHSATLPPCHPPTHPPTRRIVVVGRSTCPFCIEVTRTLTGLGLSFPYFLGGWVKEGSGQ